LFALALGAVGAFVDGMAKTIFERIIAREIPAKIEHEDDVCVVLHDIQPQAPVHLLIVPKKVIPRVGEATAADQATLGHLLLVAAEMARKLQLAQGFRLVINNGPHASESVPHLHVHLLAKRQMTWPPG
jgi:histidine triad (HIT) family protein